MKKLMTILAVAMVAQICAVQANASLTTYDSRSAWRSSVGGSQAFFENFNSYSSDVAASGVLDVGPLTLTPVGSWYMPIIDVTPYGNTGIDGTAGVTLQALWGVSLVVTFDAPLNGFGFDYGSAFGDNRPITITTSNGDGYTFVAHYGGTDRFLGIGSGAQFNSVTFTSTSNVRPLADNFEGIARVSAPVPEPSALLALLSGVSGLSGLFSKRRKA